MSSLIRSRLPQVVACANWGRWVVACMRCPSALTVPPGTPLVTCWDCGTDVEVIWPPETVVQGVERLLSLRPDVSTRNWWPGETLHDLLADNMAHGVIAPDSDGPIMAIVGDRIELDTLPASRTREAIGGR